MEKPRRHRRFRRHVPQRRLHSFQGAAGVDRAVPPDAGGVRGARHQGVGRDARPRADAEAQERHRARHDAGDSRPVQGGRRHPAPIELRSAAFRPPHIVDSWGALEFEAVPKRLGVIGAGVIGLELGSVWRRLGAQVVVLEALPDVLPVADQQLAREALRHFKKLGLDIRLGTKVTGAAVSGGAVEVTYEDGKGAQRLAVDRLVVAIGRRPYTKDLLGPETGVQLDERGFITVDETCRSGVEGVWAIGDCVRGPMLAHKGKEEGVMVADLIAGRFGEMNYNVIPSVIYTAPEIAWVGLTEEQVKASGRQYKTGVFPFLASGRARALEQATGFAKIVAARDDDEILGVHIVGPMAGELIAEAVLAMEYSASSEDLQRTIHAHPTLAEALHEAALAADGRSIDAINR